MSINNRSNIVIYNIGLSEAWGIDYRCPRLSSYNQSNDRIKIYTHIKPFLQEDGAPTKRISLRNSTSKASWGWGNKENFTEKFNKQSKLGMGPQQREFH